MFPYWSLHFLQVAIIVAAIATDPSVAPRIATVDRIELTEATRVVKPKSAGAVAGSVRIRSDDGM